MSTTAGGSIGNVTSATAPRPIDWAWLRSTSYRRKLQLVLGLIWLIDAALQYQPYMFGRAFVTQTLEPAASGTPYLVERPSLWAAHFMIHHVAVYNSLFATIQLVIALALLYRPLVKLGLAVSIVWALAVWWLGEGIGGITVGVSPVMGAPGAAVLYALIALLVWPRRQRSGALSVAESGPLGSFVPKVLWAAMWLGFVLLTLEAVNRAPSALHDMITGMSAGEPAWIHTLNRALVAPLAHHGTEASIILAVLFAFVGLGIFVPGAVRPALITAIVLAVASWLAEDFGGVFTGSDTDVNSGPLLVLLAACFWPVKHRQGSSGRMGWNSTR
jgi:hypothetical protein